MSDAMAVVLLDMGPIGWLVAVAVGFVVGGVFFLSMKLQVEYVVEHRGPEWLLPAAMYARMILIATALVLAVAYVPRPKLAAATVGGLVGAMVARVVVSRMVKRGEPSAGDDQGETDAD